MTKTGEPIRSRGIHHVAFTTRDVDATCTFYTEKLGMRLLHAENHRQGDGHFRHFFFATGEDDDPAIAFFALGDVGERPDFGTDISTGLGLPVWANHIAFRLDALEELDAMASQLQERGVEQVTRIDHGWCESIYTMDPNGIMVEFCVTTDADAFGQSEREARALLAVPASEISEATRKEPSLARRA